jgi:hypothetical protein
MTDNRGRLGSAARGAVSLLVALTLGAAGCGNLFLPSKPEPPSADSGIPPVDIDFSTPEGVCQTLALAIAAKNRSNGFRAYMAVFADTTTQGLGLQIDLDPDVVRERDEATVPIPPRWLRQNEAVFYLYLSGLNPGEYDFSWTNNGDVFDGSDHAILSRTYVLNATATDGSVTQLATGNAELDMRRIPGSPQNWVIVRWTDTLLPGIGPTPDPEAGLYCFSRLRIDSYNH